MRGNTSEDESTEDYGSGCDSSNVSIQVSGKRHGGSVICMNLWGVAVLELDSHSDHNNGKDPIL